MIHWITDALSHCFNDRFTDWLTDWLLRWFIDSLIHWLTDALIHCFVDSLIHWFVDSLAHWFIGSLVHWFTDSFDSLGHRWFTDSLVQFVSVVDSLLCCFIDSLAFGSLIHWVSDSSTHYSTSPTHWLIASLLRCFIDSLIPWFIEWWIHPLMCSFMSFHLNLNNQLLIRWCISQIQHFIASASPKKKLSYGPSSSYSCFIFSKLLPRCVPGTIWYLYLSVLCFLVCGSPLEEKIQRPRTNMIDVLQHLPWLNLPC